MRKTDDLDTPVCDKCAANILAGKLEPAWLPIWHLKKCDHGKQVEVKCDDGSVGVAQYDHPCAFKFGKITTGNPVEWRHVYGQTRRG